MRSVPRSLAELRLTAESAFEERLPAPQSSAWATAVEFLEWVTTRWEQANDHVDTPDAVEVLGRADRGERFACVEYSIVLCQALNTVGVPARRLSLCAARSHTGFARGHVVTEAWIDDLNKWVILDGQNGAWWGSPTEPLGWDDLIALRRRAATRADVVTTTRRVTSEDMDTWWSYFDTAVTSGMGWSRPFSPFFQQQPMTIRLLTAPSTVVHPDLSELETSLVDLGESPGIAFRPVHPYATGVRMGNMFIAPGEPVSLDDIFTGRTRIDVAATTRYQTLASHTLSTTEWS